jgi:hypothetical protein
MKCDLCKRQPVERQLLCDTCAEAIRRLVIITRQPTDQDKPLAARAA